MCSKLRKRPRTHLRCLDICAFQTIGYAIGTSVVGHLCAVAWWEQQEAREYVLRRRCRRGAYFGWSWLREGTHIGLGVQGGVHNGESGSQIDETGIWADALFLRLHMSQAR